MKAIIYDNEKCTKSNAALGLLVKQDVEVSIVNYLETPSSLELLKIYWLNLELKQAASSVLVSSLQNSPAVTVIIFAMTINGGHL